MSRAGRVAGVVLVGRGRMASAFENALRASGVVFATVRGRSLQGLSSARRIRRDAPLLWVIAVTDAAIEQCVDDLVARGAIVRGDAVVHLAGARGVEELESARGIGAAGGAMHPLVAVASRKRPPSLVGKVASFEGDRRAFLLARRTLAPVGLTVVAIHQVDRARYHAAAALVATGSIALAQGAEGLFQRAAARGVTRRVASAFAASLLASAAHNVAAVGASAALASPLMRGDTRTVERHLASMEILPRARQLYLAALGQVVEELSRGRSLDAGVLRRARALLKAAESGDG